MSAAIAGVSMMGCGDDDAVANLLPPPDGGVIDGDVMDGTVMDGEVMIDGDVFDATGFPDAVIANLLPPPDDGGDNDAGT